MLVEEVMQRVWEVDVRKETTYKEPIPPQVDVEVVEVSVVDKKNFKNLVGWWQTNVCHHPTFLAFLANSLKLLYEIKGIACFCCLFCIFRKEFS